MKTPKLPALPVGDALLPGIEPPAKSRSALPARLEALHAAAPVRTTAASEYRPLFARSVLNENPNPALPFRWTINPYRGCEFGCGYCYARYTHDFLEHRKPEEFEQRIYVKLGVRDLLIEELRRGVARGQTVAFGTATDPYQPAEKHFGITRSLLEVLAEHRDVRVSITTKSPLVLRDLDLIRRMAAEGRCTVQVTITTLHAGLARVIEHRAPAPRRRLETIRTLAAAGVPTAVFAMPILPGMTDHRDELERLLVAARRAGATSAGGNTLHLESAAKRSFFPILRRHFPELVTRYEELYGRSNLAPESVRQETLERFRAARAAAGFEPTPAKDAVGDERSDPRSSAPKSWVVSGPEQLSLPV